MLYILNIRTRMRWCIITSKGNKLEDIIEITNALCEIALKCDSCAVQFKRIIQDYRNSNNSSVNPVRGHSSLVTTNENVGKSNEFYKHKYS